MSDFEQRGPWRRLSSDIVYDNRWISVRHEQVITPAGEEGVYGLVHFKSRAIAIIPVDDEDHTWLVRQFRYATNQPSWELPMGGGPLDEAPQQAARRELAEETGLVAAELIELMRLYTSNSVTDESGVIYLARGLTPGPQSLEPSESDLEAVRLPLSQAIGWAMDGTITDVISIAGLLKLQALRQSGALP